MGCSEDIRVFHRDDLPLGGFAGIVETRMVMSPRVWPEMGQRQAISHGPGRFVYMAIGHFKPNDGAPPHPYRNVNIVTLIPSGGIGHEDTDDGGTVIRAPGGQVSRAERGMARSEFSAASSPAEFVQLWFPPPHTALDPGHRNFPIPVDGKLHTVPGDDRNECFDSVITCQFGYLNDGERHFDCMYKTGSGIEGRNVFNS